MSKQMDSFMNGTGYGHFRFLMGLMEELNKPEKKGWIIHHNEMGVFLGQVWEEYWMWSADDPVVSRAISFDSEIEAHRFLRDVKKKYRGGVYQVLEVNLDEEGFATPEACIAVGLPGWEVDEDEE